MPDAREGRWTIAIAKADIRGAALAALPVADLPDGAVEVAVDRFALTANNITYALFGKPSGLFGDNQGYWDFFSPDASAPGALPVWGFGSVIASRCPGVMVGETIYGYLPMASHAVLVPSRVGRGGFADLAGQRATLPIIYNQYQRLAALADYRAADHDYWPIFRPLFLTGWLIADQLAEYDDYGADQILVASASSKTAIGLAFAHRQRGEARPRCIGLTSAANAPALSARGIYDAVVTYDDIAGLDAAAPSLLVDMAGNAAVYGAVHRHFGAALRRSIVVGKSHWDADGGGGERLPGPPREGFFAPARSEKRIADWGGAGFQARVADAWAGFMALAPTLARVDVRAGGAGALAAYMALLDGRADPAAGIIIAAQAAGEGAN